MKSVMMMMMMMMMIIVIVTLNYNGIFAEYLLQFPGKLGFCGIPFERRYSRQILSLVLS
jgi:hypothetical protein